MCFLQDNAWGVVTALQRIAASPAGLRDPLGRPVRLWVELARASVTDSYSNTILRHQRMLADEGRHEGPELLVWFLSNQSTLSS